MKKQILLSLFVVATFCSKAQVNLQTGSAEFSLPIYNYKDNYSGISLNVAVSYSSKNGILVDEVPSSLGQGWNINGLGLIARIERGLPDDQFGIDGNWNDLNKYPPGILYNSNPVSAGCPTLLNYYPIFETKDQSYKDHNITMSDRERDIFVYEFNGRTGRFIIDKNSNVVMLNDSRLKASIQTNYATACRTMIDKFIFTDESGIVYEFAEKEFSKTFDYYEDENNYQNYLTASNIFNTPHEIPSNYNPYTTKNWYLSKIFDPITNRAINFNYTIVNTEMDGAFDIQYKYKNGSYAPQSSNYVPGLNYPRKSTIITKIKNSFKKPEISKISFPDNSYIDFNYSQERLDCPGTYKLNNISSFNSAQERISKVVFDQKYFVKNSIIEADANNSKWSRLCLKTVIPFGKTDNDKTGSYLFDYYLGEDATENFVPPIFFHAKDPWGYYNGNYSGTNVNEFMTQTKLNETSTVPPANFNTNAQRLALYNSPEINSYYPGAANFEQDCLTYIRSNTKTNYARNGLLKSITNPYGGTLNYFYEQNKSDADCFYAPSHNIDDKVIGGVHVSKVESASSLNIVPSTIEYKYINSDGTSSMWGTEYPTNIKRYAEYYEPFSKFVTPGGCNYHYKYSGKTRSQIASNSNSNKILQVVSLATKIAKAAGIIKDVLAIIRDPNRIALPSTAIVQFIVDFINSCDANYDNGVSYIHQNSILNYSNTLPAQFKRVEVSTYSNGLTNGKSIYEFTSSDDFSVTVPKNYFPYISKQRAYNWIYGLPKKTSVYDNNNQILKSVENTYHLIENKFTSDNTSSCNCSPAYFKSKRFDEWLNETNSFTTSTLYKSGVDGTTIPSLSVEAYNESAGRVELLNTTEKVYKSSTNFLSSTTYYTYNTQNYLMASSKSIDDKGREIENKIYYVEDYDLNNSSNMVLKTMRDKNYINIPVSTETWQKRAGQQPELLSATATEFGTTYYGNGRFVPVKLYGLQTDKPVAQNIIGTFDPAKLVRDASLIKPVKEMNYQYWASGPQETIDIIGNRAQTYLYRYSDGLPIAIITNANSDDCAYIPSANFTGNTMFFSMPTVIKDSKITFLASSGNKIKIAVGQWNGNSWIFNDINPTVSENAINGMVYYEYNVAAGYRLEVRNDNSCQMDEFRFYPKNAFMETVTYNTEGKKIRDCDTNNRNTYYEYDGLGRLSKVLDENRNIIKTYEYNFKN